MNTLQIKVEPIIIDLTVSADSLMVVLADGREVSTPIEWFPRLRDASEEQRKKWRLIGKGVGIHWEDIDEDISVKSLLTFE